MMMGNVVEMVLPAARVRRVREALDRWRAATEGWIEATLALAEELYQARQDHPSNTAFGVWLVENGLDDLLSGDDRAALINMAEHRDLARQVMAETDRRSVKWIWRDEIQPRLRHVAKTGPESSSEPESPETPVIPQESDEASSEITPPADIEVSARQRRTNKFAQLPDGDLLLGHLKHVHARKTLNKIVEARGGKAAATLVADCIKNGAFGLPSDASVTKPNLRLAMPWAPQTFAQRFDLTKDGDRKLIRDEVLPIVLEHRSALAERPEDLPLLIRNAALAREEAKRAEIEAGRRRAALQRMSPGEQEIIAYGKRLWPRDNDGPISYDELCLAIWYVDYLWRQFPADWKAADRALQTKQLLKWIPPALKGKGWEFAVRELCNCHETAPEAECRFPTVPINFGLS